MSGLLASVNTGVMTETLLRILGVLESGASALSGGAMGVLATLAAIELVWMGIQHALGAGDIWQGLVRKIVHIGIYAFIVMNFATLATTMTDGFLWAGSQVGGGVTMSALRNPSAIAFLGFSATAEIWGTISILTIWDDGILSNLLMGMIGLIAAALFFAVALQIFVAMVEFHVILGFGVIFVPWGVNKHTAWITEKYFGAVIAQGVKLMVLATLLGIIRPIIDTLKLPPDPTFTHALSLMFGIGTMAYLVARAPAVASGLMSGAASLNASDALGSATGAATTAGAVASGGAGAIASGAKGAVKKGVEVAQIIKRGM